MCFTIETVFSEKGLLELDIKDVFTRYTNDVIASSAFGIRVNSLKERDNQFYALGKETTNFRGTVLIKFFLMMVVPAIAKVNQS